MIASDADTESVLGKLGLFAIDSETVVSSLSASSPTVISFASDSDIVTGVASTSSSEGSKSIKSVNTFTRDSIAVTESVFTSCIFFKGSESVTNTSLLSSAVVVRVFDTALRSSSLGRIKSLAKGIVGCIDASI